MSDSTNQGGAGGDFRGSREEKRQDETVMISSDNLSNLVNEAKATPPPVTPGPTSPPAAAPAESGGSKNMLVVVIGVVLVLAVVIALVYSFAKT